MSYDVNGNLDGLPPASQPEHAFTYDGADRLTVYDPRPVSGVSAPETTSNLGRLGAT